MSGLEAIAVIGVVASLITAFKDSSTIANAIKQRRKSKPGTLPPTIELEEALAIGEKDIQKAAAEGIRRWGQNWVDDDVDVKMALLALVVEVQASMLKDLSIAVQDDSITDFTNVIEVSTETRMKAVNILTSLYLRKKEHASSKAEEQAYYLTRASARVFEHEQSPPQQRSRPLPISDRSRGVTELPRKQETANERRKPSNEMRHRTERRPEPEQEQPRRSWKRKLSGWTQSYVGEQLNSPASDPIEQPALRYSRSPIQTRADPLNPWSKTCSTTDSDSWQSVHSVQSQPLFRRDTRLSTQTTMISPDSDYGGFCQGAYQLQVGLIDSALKIHNASTSMTGQGQYYACRGKRCVFEGPAVVYEKGWSYDKNLRTSLRNRLEYRWIFLGKSHIPQERVKQKLYDFRCLICVFLGDESSTFHGSNQLLEHVGGHAGTQIAGITLLGPLVLGNNSITQARDDNFDINFLSDRTSSLLEQSSSPTSTQVSSDVMSVEDYDTLSTFHPNWR